MRLFKEAIITSVILMSVNVKAAPVAVLDYDNDLIGIKGIEITSYGTWDVSFNDVWQGDLHTVGFAENATTAIHDIFSPGGFLSGSIYDITPYRNITGCNDSNHCDTFTVTDSSNISDPIPAVRGYFWRNFTGNYPAAESPETATIYTKGIQSPNASAAIIHASWDNSQYVSNVPLPASGYMFGAALLGLVALRRKTKATVA